MAEGSRTTLRYIKENEYGITPTGKFKSVAFTEESFKLNRTKEKSKKVMPTREYSGMTTKTQAVEGGFSNPLQSVNTDELLEGVLMSSWIDVVGGTGGGQISAGATVSDLDLVFTHEAVVGEGGTIEFGSSITIDILKDQVIFVSGTPNDGENDGSYIVKSIAGQIVVVNDPLITATYEADCTVKGDRLRNAADIKSYTFERAHLDIDKFFQYVGEVLGNLEVKFEPETEVELAFDYNGKTETTSNQSVSTPLPDNSTDTPYFVTGEDVDGVYFDYEIQDNCLIQSLSFKIDNQTEGRKSIAVFGACNQRIKPIDVTGSIAMAFNNLLNYNKYPEDIPFNLCIIIGDSLGNKFAFTFPKTEFITGSTNVSDMEDEIPEEHDFQSTSNGAFTVQICKALA